MAQANRHTWAWVLGIVGAAVAGLAIGAAGHAEPARTSADERPVPTATSAPPVAPVGPPPTTVTVTAAAPARTVTKTVTKTVTTQPKTSPVNEFGDGTYLVGTDVAAGSYRSSGPRPGAVSACYWARLRDDSGQDIIANAFAQGPTRLTARAGEYLEINGCDFVSA
jgi:hypothetical protein